MKWMIQKNPKPIQNQYTYNIEVGDYLVMGENGEPRVNALMAMELAKRVSFNPAHQYEIEWSLAILLELACEELTELRKVQE
jgi:hypothetical protein